MRPGGETMINKDYITILKDNGIMEKMEVVSIFRLEETKKDCIIYKSLNDEKYYAASYNKDKDYSVLNTEFTDMEKEHLNKIFEFIKNGGEVNAWIQ